MRKLVSLIVISFVALSLSFDSVSAYPGGLMHGQPVFDTGDGKYHSEITDGNLDTYRGVLGNRLVYTFPEIATISYLKTHAYRSSSATVMRVYFYSEGGTLLGSKDISINAKQDYQVSIGINSVKRIEIANAANFWVYIYEFDVFGAYAGSPPPAPTGLTASVKNGNVTLNWGPVEGFPDLAGYNVYKNGQKLNATPITSTSYVAEAKPNVTETWQVTAIRETGAESERSDPVYTYFDTVPPAAPIGIRATPQDSKVILYWNQNKETDLFGYYVYKDGVRINDSPITDTTFTVTGLQNGVNHTYTITAVDTSGNESKHSAAIIIAAIDPPPETPKNFRATPGDRSIRLDWDANQEDDLAGYKLYSGSTFLMKLPGWQTSVQLTGLVNGQLYTYRLTAYDNAGNESPYAEISARPADTTPPAAPKNLNGAPGNGLVNLFWTANAEADLAGYYIYQDGQRLNVPLSKDIYRTIRGLENGTTYTFQVSAVDTAGNESPKSNAVQLTPDVNADSTPPGVPTGLRGEVVQGNIRASWNANTEPDMLGYFLYVDGKRVTYAPISANQYTILNLEKGRTYRLEVSAIDNSGNESEKSPPVDVFLNNLPVPSGLKAKQITGGIRLTWNATEPPPDKYVIYRNGIKIAEVDEPGFLDDTAEPEYTYRYQVAGVFDSVESDRAEVAIYYSLKSPPVDFGESPGLPFSVPGMIRTAVNFLDKYGLWILLALGVIFALALVSPAQNSVNQAQKGSRGRKTKNKADRNGKAETEKAVTVKVSSEPKTGRKRSKGDRSHLVPQTIVYQRNGKNYTRTVYVKPENYKQGQVIRLDKGRR